MDDSARVGFRYHPKHCALLGKTVWAIMTQQADGSWRVVNCLDKDEGCFHIECAFTTDHGAWPYERCHVEQARQQP